MGKYTPKCSTESGYLRDVEKTRMFDNCDIRNLLNIIEHRNNQIDKLVTEKLSLKNTLNIIADDLPHMTDSPMTCCNCKDKWSCNVAFDLYNINGECLASK